MAFTIDKWGPKRLRKIWESIEGEINRNRPTSGLGTDVDVTNGGSQISISSLKPPGGTDKENAQGGGTGGGSSVNLYGAFNGAPALFHLSQTSPPTPL